MPAGISYGNGATPTPNDSGDRCQNYPHLFSNPAHPGRQSAQIAGTFATSLGGGNYVIEFFGNESADPSGYGEGQTFLGSTTIAVGFSGIGDIDVTLSVNGDPGNYLTATATAPDGSTSEFSKAVLIQGPTSTFPNKGISDVVQQQVPGGNGSLNSLSASARSNLQLQGGAGGKASGSAAALPVAVDARRSRGNEALTTNAQLSLLTSAPTSATGDGNGDGIQDYLQANVVSFPGITGKWITLASPTNTALENVEPTGPPDFANIPAGYTFPLGFVSFSVTGLTPGGTVTVTNFFHDEFDYDTVFAYGPTPDNAQPHWYEFLFDGAAGAKLDLDGFTLTFIDGGVGDHDLQANGAITTVLAAAHKIPPGPQLSLRSTVVGSGESISIDDTSATFQLTTNVVPVVSSVLSWPASATNYVLQFTDDLSPANVLDFTSGFSPGILLANRVRFTGGREQSKRRDQHRRQRDALLPTAKILNLSPPRR